MLQAVTSVLFSLKSKTTWTCVMSNFLILYPLSGSLQGTSELLCMTLWGLQDNHDPSRQGKSTLRAPRKVHPWSQLLIFVHAFVSSTEHWWQLLHDTVVPLEKQLPSKCSNLASCRPAIDCKTQRHCARKLCLACISIKYNWEWETNTKVQHELLQSCWRLWQIGS